MRIDHKRTYLADRTTGRLLIDGIDLGATLEDVGRPHGVKIPKETCIPEGVYKVRITDSVRFKRPMILLYTDPKTQACTLGGCTFTGIRVHKGTKTEHTEGCVLFAGDLAGLESRIAKALTSGEPVEWVISRA